MDELLTEAILSEKDDWQDTNHSLPVPFWLSLYEDLIAHIPPESRHSKLAIKLFRIGLQSSGLHVMLVYRLAHLLRHHLGLPGRIIAFLLFWLSRHWYGCDISPVARLHGGIIFPHPRGIVIGADVVIGPRSWIFQNVTIGGAPSKDGMPRIGSDARIYAGAVVVGPIFIGDNVMIASNAVVSESIPSRTLVRLPQVVLSPLPEHFRAVSE